MSKITTSRLEAFSDGVIAIIVTIMVLQLTTPAQPTFPALLKQAPIFLSYALSFLLVVIMWVNHHHLVHAVQHVTALVKSEPAVLDVADPVRDGLPGPQPESVISGVPVRSRLDTVRIRVLDYAIRDCAPKSA
jgi:hypothetical protein